MKKNIFIAALAVFCVAGSALAQDNFDDLPIPDDGSPEIVDHTPDHLEQAKMARPIPGSSRVGNNPVLFLIGNSTMRNGVRGNGNNGQWGWGYFADKYIDLQKISVENQALGGMSTRTFYTHLWADIRNALRPGDYVIISIGHNDGGPFDEGRARAVIKGTGNDSIEVTIKETGVKETVYTYGGYIRRYIAECRAAGAKPILLSLTPRNQRTPEGSIVVKPQSQWLATIAAEEEVPYVDLNTIAANAMEKFSTRKVNYLYFKDDIHFSALGADFICKTALKAIADSPNPMLGDFQKFIKTDELFPETQVARQTGKPVVFITGDSTVKNKDSDPDGMWGMGSQAYTIFDSTRITCVNEAKAGRSARSFLAEGRWDKVYNALQPGDFVLIQFGHNDVCSLTDKKARGSIVGTADTCGVYTMEADSQFVVVYSFGWYLKKFIDDVREKGATPILVSLTPRNEWPHGKIERRNNSYGKWYREVVDATNVEFVDLHNISADFLDAKFANPNASAEEIKKQSNAYFKQDHTHTSLIGAQMNAQSLAKGLREINSELAKYLLK